MEVASADKPYRLKPFKYSSHYWILKCVADAGRPLKILDVGTADGYLGEILKDHGHFLVGVENDPVLSERAKPYYDVMHNTDIESFDFPYREEFDVIIFADVLEHLKEPETVLRRAATALRPGSHVIISVPNVANIVIRLSLLFGHFDYASRGILDRTHLRFFTLASLRRLVENCGFKIITLCPSPIPVQIVWPFTKRGRYELLHELHYAVVKIWKALFAYQYVIYAERRVLVSP